MLQKYILELINLLNEMSPYLLLGFLIAGILHVVMPNQKVVRYLGGNNLRSVINASLLGIPIPICSCGVIPTGLSFYKNGASKGSSVSFLISTPQTGIDTFMVTYSLLGLPLAVLRPVIAFFIGILGGTVTNEAVKNEKQMVQTGNHEKINRKNYKDAIATMLRFGFVEFLQDIAKWLVIGLLIAALLSVLMPENFFTAYLSNEYLSMLVVLLASVPLYGCATSSVPIAAMLMMKGLSPGAVIVFLMAGPATNATTITMVGKVLGRKALFSYLFSTIVGAIVCGILVNEFIPREWFMGNMNMHHTHNHEELLPFWIQALSSIALSLLILNTFRLQYLSSRRVENQPQQAMVSDLKTTTVIVQGMNCNHCKTNVERNLMGLPGIKIVTVNLQQESVTIEADHLDLGKVKSTVEGLGYIFVSGK